MFASLLKTTGADYQMQFSSSIKKPVIKNHHVVLRILYCGVNHLDFLIAIGKRIGPKMLPHILGSEIVGEIVSLKNSTTQFKVGDRAGVYPWTYCGVCPPCQQGNVQLCNKGGTIGRTSWGGYAEFVSVPIQNIVKIPKSISPALACTVILSGTTAYHLIRRLAIPDKSTVLITGATGGVGVLLIQMLKHKNCEIVAITSSKSKRGYLKKIGVDDVFMLQSFPQNVLKKFPSGFSYIVDIMGGDIWSSCIRLLAKSGSMSFCATTRNEFGRLDIGSAFSREINIHGSYGGTIKDMKTVIRLVQKGILRPEIYRTMPLKDIPLALKLLRKREVFGKLLIKVQNDKEK